MRVKDKHGNWREQRDIKVEKDEDQDQSATLADYLKYGIGTPEWIKENGCPQGAQGSQYQSESPRNTITTKDVGKKRG